MYLYHSKANLIIELFLNYTKSYIQTYPNFVLICSCIDRKTKRDRILKLPPWNDNFTFLSYTYAYGNLEIIKSELIESYVFYFSLPNANSFWHIYLLFLLSKLLMFHFLNLFTHTPSVWCVFFLFCIQLVCFMYRSAPMARYSRKSRQVNWFMRF